MEQCIGCKADLTVAGFVAMDGAPGLVCPPCERDMRDGYRCARCAVETTDGLCTNCVIYMEQHPDEFPEE